MSETKKGRGELLAGGIAALLASTCCLGPLILVSIGVSGAWIGNLSALEHYRPIFIGAALVALFFAWKRIFRSEAECKPGEVCALPAVRSTYKICFLAGGRPDHRGAGLSLCPAPIRSEGVKSAPTSTGDGND